MDENSFIIDKDIIISACQTSISMADAIRKVPQINQKTFRKYAKILGVYNTNIGGVGVSRTRKDGEGKIPLHEILDGHHPQYSSHKLKLRLFSSGLKEFKCEICGISEWMGSKAPLQLDHINGINNDNRLENLQILCANCHAQTDTYCGRNIVRKCGKKQKLIDDKKFFCKMCGDHICKRTKSMLCRACVSVGLRKVDRPSIEKLLELLETMNYVSVGKMFGVSDNTIRKWLRFYDKK